MNKDLEFTKKLLKDTALFVLDSLERPYNTRWKSDNTPVTDIDFLVTKKITEALGLFYPKDTIYGEEEAKKEGESGFSWILDPIDGTQALGMLSVSTICLARIGLDGQPLFSVILNPTTNEIFYSEKTKSYLNEKMIRVSSKKDIKGSYVYLGSRMSKKHASNGAVYDLIEGLGGKVFNIRSLAYSCMMVASGKAVGAYIGVSTPFEAASVKLIVENAGGKITDLSGGIIKRFDTSINGLIASNNAQGVHKKLIGFVQKKQ